MAGEIWWRQRVVITGLPRVIGHCMIAGERLLILGSPVKGSPEVLMTFYDHYHASVPNCSRYLNRRCGRALMTIVDGMIPDAKFNFIGPVRIRGNYYVARGVFKETFDFHGCIGGRFRLEFAKPDYDPYDLTHIAGTNRLNYVKDRLSTLRKRRKNPVKNPIYKRQEKLAKQAESQGSNADVKEGIASAGG
jgi:hypothetical protein